MRRSGRHSENKSICQQIDNNGFENKPETKGQVVKDEVATEHDVGNVPPNHSFVVKRVLRKDGR